MPMINVNGIRLYHTDSGGEKPAVVFSHGLLFGSGVWANQVEFFKDNYRVITYDHRGQGQSEVSASGYDMDSVTADAAALIRALGVEGCHFVGLSMGGFVALRLALNYPELVSTISVLDSSAEPEPPENHGKYKFLNFMQKWFGKKIVMGSVMPIMFGQTFLNDPARHDEVKYWRRFLETTGGRKGASRAVMGVIERTGVSDRIAGIKIPTLIAVGAEDIATVPEKSERMHAAIPGSEFVLIPKAGHQSNVDAPDAVNAALSDFLARHSKS